MVSPPPMRSIAGGSCLNAEASGDAVVELDEPADGLGAAVARAGGVEVAEELTTAPSQVLCRGGDLRDRAGGERRDDLLRNSAACGMGVQVVRRADLLGAAPCEFDVDVPLFGGPGRFEAGGLPVGECSSLAGRVADPVRRVVLAAAVAGGVLLDPAAVVVDDLRGVVDHLEPVAH